MTDTWPVLYLAGLGAFHGLNPAMGWLFAVALGLNRQSRATVFASLRYTGRTASDPLGVMSLPETTVAAGAAAETSGRWGDYYQMTVDPVDDCTFWFVGMYRPSGGWQTRIQDFKFPGC